MISWEGGVYGIGMHGWIYDTDCISKHIWEYQLNISERWNLGYVYNKGKPVLILSYRTEQLIYGPNLRC